MIRITLSLLFLTLFACGESSTTTERDASAITLRNATDIERKDEVVLIPRSSFLAHDDSTGEVPLLKTSDGKTPPQQHDDLDGDGRWDEAAVLLSFQPSEKVTLDYTYTNESDLPSFENRTFARLGVLDGDTYKNVDRHTRPSSHKAHDPLYHVEGVSWENDLIGFRNYFDERNGKDIFGKRVPNVVLDTVDLGSAYHDLGDWGMDILKVGNSLGAGALGAIVDGKLIRLGPTKTATYELVKNGPIRSIFDLKYTDWDVAGKVVDLTERITITAGNHYYKSTVTVDGYGSAFPLITGIVNLQSERAYSLGGNNMSGFGTWDNQSYIEDGLGMAILYPGDALDSFKSSPEEGEGITQTFYQEFAIEPEDSFTFYFVAGWETADDQFGTQEGFDSVVSHYLTKLGSPIEVKTK